MRIILLALGLATGCATTAEYKACESMCKELVRTCSYEAFPTTDSCMVGCAEEAANGADVFGQEDLSSMRIATHSPSLNVRTATGRIANPSNGSATKP